MANAGWGHGRPVESDTGISQVLHAYVSHGGQLYGARRWPENPLTLTHVRWQGPAGVAIDAFRKPDETRPLSQEERDVWVELAVHCPAAPNAPMGNDAPWLPIQLDPTRAGTFLQLLQQAQARSAPRSPYTPAPPVGGSWPAPVNSAPPAYPTDRARAGGPPPGTYPQQQRQPFAASQQETEMLATPSPAEPRDSGANVAASQQSDAGQWTGGWQRRPSDEVGEVAALVAIEVELPPMMGGPAMEAYRRDFSRDVATHFVRAASTIPQVHEKRGWMRGNHMVLAARYVIAMGTRPPTQPEVEAATENLANVLRQWTIPFVWIGFANPGEWLQGATLPE